VPESGAGTILSDVMVVMRRHVVRDRIKILCGLGSAFVANSCGFHVAAMDVRRARADLRRMTKPSQSIGHERPQVSVLGHVEHYAGAVAMVAVCTLVGMWIAPRWGTAAVDMIYLPAVLAAAFWGFGPAFVAGVTAALAYNFFFTAPVHTFRIDRVTDVVTVVILLIVALVTSRLAAGIREQARVAAAHAARNATIAGFARRL